MDLKYDGYSKYGNKRRLKKTVQSIDFIQPPILDIGSENKFSKDVHEELLLKWPLTNTSGDLDLNGWSPLTKTHDFFCTVFCFEVIEHLMSPRMFLERLKSFIDNSTIIYLTYPRRNELFWTDIHFHEYSRKRFLTLLNESGYKVLKYTWWYEFNKFHFGIRPLLRMTPIGMKRSQFYKLRLK